MAFCAASFLEVERHDAADVLRSLFADEMADELGRFDGLSPGDEFVVKHATIRDSYHPNAVLCASFIEIHERISG